MPKGKTEIIRPKKAESAKGVITMNKVFSIAVLILMIPALSWAGGSKDNSTQTQPEPQQQQTPQPQAPSTITLQPFSANRQRTFRILSYIIFFARPKSSPLLRSAVMLTAGQVNTLTAYGVPTMLKFESLKNVTRL